MKLILVEDSAADAGLVREMLSDAASTEYEIVTVPRLGDALDRLNQEPFDAILLDLGLPDARGLDGLQTLQRTAPDVPIVILSGLDDKALALEAVRQGAQDYLLKGQNNGPTLARTVLHATERKRAELEVRHM